MNNFVKSPLTNTTPIKRIGLSRKRKTFSQCGVIVKEDTVKDCSKSKISRQDVENINQLDISGAENSCQESEKIKSSISKTDDLKCPLDMKEKIAELENLYATWKNGCKIAVLYLLDKLKKTESEEVHFKELLKQLGVFNIISNHFIDDSDLDFCTSLSD